MVNLSKGQKFSLDKSMNLCLVGLGWDPNEYSNSKYDLDATAFLLGANGKVHSDNDFIFYGNKVHPSGAVKAGEDDTDGSNSNGGDDEKIIINLDRIPSYVERIVICVSIYEAHNRRQSFAQISNAYVRVLKIKREGDEDGEEVVRYDLDEEFSEETAISACEIIRNGNEWKFSALGMGYDCELDGLCRKYGVDI